MPRGILLETKAKLIELILMSLFQLSNSLRFIIYILFYIDNSRPENEQSLDTVIRIHNDVSTLNFCHFQIYKIVLCPPTP